MLFRSAAAAAVASILPESADAVDSEIVGTVVPATGYHRQHERSGLVSDRSAVAVDRYRRLLSDMDQSRRCSSSCAMVKYQNSTLQIDGTLVAVCRSSCSAACATPACCFVSLKRFDEGSLEIGAVTPSLVLFVTWTRIQRSSFCSSLVLRQMARTRSTPSQYGFSEPATQVFQLIATEPPSFVGRRRSPAAVVGTAVNAVRGGTASSNGESRSWPRVHLGRNGYHH